MNLKTKALLMQMFKILGWVAPILFAILFFWAASSSSWLAANILGLATGRAKWTAFVPFGIVLIALIMATMWLPIPKLVLSIANSVVFSSLIGIYWAFGLWNFSIKQRDDAILLLSAGFVGYLIYRAIAKLIDNQQ